MPQIDIQIHVLLQQFEDANPCRLGEALFFPDVTCLNHIPDEVRNLVAENVLSLLIHVPNERLLQRTLMEPPQRFDVSLVIEPAERNRIWQEPVTLNLPAVKWQQTTDCCVVYIPCLGIEVLANEVEDLCRLVEDQVRLTLFRLKITRSLKSLILQTRCQDVSIHSVNLEHFVNAPKQQHQNERRPDPNESKVLQKIGEPITGLSMPQAFEREAMIRQLADALSGRLARSVLLVGSSGVGKTAVLKEVARRSSELGLSSWKFWATSGSRLVSGMTGFGMWQERCETLRKELVRDSVILHVGSLMELMEVGRSEGQSQGIASFLRPAIARAEILLVAECTPEQLSWIERQDVALFRAFLRLSVEEPARDVRIRVLTQIARTGWTSTRQLFSSEAIEQIERLHRRFATYSAFPARPVRFLQNLRRDAGLQRFEASTVESNTAGVSESSQTVKWNAEDGESVISSSDVTRAFSRETGLPLWMLEDQILLNLQTAEEWFASRVIGQPESVQLVLSLLSTLKAQLNRENKPLASFLFIGPTGVGKTEMARTLAEYMFGASGSADSRMIRIDMSEYADPFAVQRLIGGSSQSEGVLTGRVREQPFSVVLLDEFEKAHDSLFDLLLQILGEGRLTDAAGRIAEFRNCIIIMTSNLGASTFARGSVGFGLAETDSEYARDHFEKAVRGFVRPELFNRIDRIVPFAPLDRVTARKIVERQLELIRQRAGLKYRRVTLRLNDEVIDWLLERGFEPRYGARSLKRVMEQELLAPLAERFNCYASETALIAECRVAEATLPDDVLVTDVTEGQGQRRVFSSRPLIHSVRAQADASGRVMMSPGADASQVELVSRLQAMRSRIQRLKVSSVMLSLENQVFQLERAELRWNKVSRQFPQIVQLRQELDCQRAWLRRYDQCLNEATAQEDAALMALYASDAAAPAYSAPDKTQGKASELREFLELHRQRFSDLLFDLLDLRTEEPNQIRLMLVSDNSTALRDLVLAYLKIATSLNATIGLWQFLSPGRKREVLQEEQWTLEKLKWSEVPASSAKQESDVWRLISKEDPSQNDPVPLLLRQIVDSRRLFSDDSRDGILGLFMDLRAERIFNRFVREEGVHRFHFVNGKADCHVFTGLPVIASYLPPFGIERRGAVAQSERCRDYDYSRCRMTDTLLEQTTELLEGNLSSDLGAVLERRHQKLADRLIE